LIRNQTVAPIKIIKPFLTCKNIRVVGIQHPLPGGKYLLDLAVLDVLGYAVIPQAVIHGGNRDEIGVRCVNGGSVMGHM
jgi:hypothetical protein